MYMVASIVFALVVTSKRTTSRDWWQAATMPVPSGVTASPLQPTLLTKISHSPPSVYLMMSPRVGARWTKLVK